MTRSKVLAPVVVALSLFLVACGDDDFKPSPTPTPTPTPTVTPNPQVSRIQLATPPSMAAVGDTVKLSLTAFHTDGTSRDIAAEAAWSIDGPPVVRIANGEATALALGATFISARYQNRFASAKVQVTPPGTFAIVGGTREPGNSGLGGVTVSHPSSGLTTVSDLEGRFTLGGLMDRTIVLQKSGYEDATYFVEDADDFQWLAVQRTFRVQAGGTTSMRIAPHDMDYAPPYASVAGEHCSPCKMIRLQTTPGERVRVTVKWTQISIPVKLWTDDGTFSQAPGTAGLIEREVFTDKTEIWLYVGQTPANASLEYVDVQVTVTKVGL